MTALAPTRDELTRLLQEVRAELLRLGVQRLALFGSVLHGTSGPDSDVDLLIEFRPGQKSFDHLMAVGDLLERLLGRRVELVTPESLSPYLGPHILSDAVDVLRAA